MRATALALLTVVLLAGCSGDDSAAPAPPPTTAREDPGASVYDLEIGDCLNGLGQRQDLLVQLTPCARRHQAEVYGAFDLGARRFPGVDVLRRRAATDCAQLYAAYTGEPAGPGTEEAFVEVVPSLESWTSGDRRALCVALSLDGRRRRGSIAVLEGT